MLGEDWHRVCRVEDLGVDEVTQCMVGDTAIAVYRLEDDFYATSDICSHHGASLSEGDIEDGHIECPLHQGRYDIATGAVSRGPACADLPVYPVLTEGGWIFVQYDEDIE